MFVPSLCLFETVEIMWIVRTEFEHPQDVEYQVEKEREYSFEFHVFIRLKLNV